MAESKQDNIQNKYQKKSQHEHILLRPDTYVGSIAPDSVEMDVLKKEKGGIKIEKQTIEYAQWLYKIFDEVMVNATDQYERMRLKLDAKDGRIYNQVRNIHVKVDKDSGQISIWNDGNGLDVVYHEEHKMWIPEMVFGHLLTSTNYDETVKNTVGGRNGFGAKLTNIFSKEFTIETYDPNTEQFYTQTWTNNMFDKSKPKILKKKQKGTKIIFTPDYERFKLKGLSDGMYKLFMKRAYDAAACTPKEVKVCLNDELLPIRSLADYIPLYFDEDQPYVEEKCGNGRWDIVATVSDGKFKQVSFVNGICTNLGGTHVKHVVSQITEKIEKVIKRMPKFKDMDISKKYIEDHLFVFVKCIIEDPGFSSQTKEYLNSRVQDFGSTCTLGDTFIKNLVKKTNLVDEVTKFAAFKENKNLQKQSGKKKSRLFGIPKLDDANKAGTSQSQECTLVLTEGDSAKTMFVSMMSVLGRDLYGVFPLRGKLLNVRDVSKQKLSANEEIGHLVTILGLKYGEEYSDATSLRYGKVCIMTDADTDGSHIKGLIINMFSSLWPSLLEVEGFLSFFITPVSKATKGSEVHSFYTMKQMQDWQDDHEGESGWTLKYYKGLGTSTSKEAREYAAEWDTHNIPFSLEDFKATQESMHLAFDKTYADKRKEWLREPPSEEALDYAESDTLSYETFIHKELKLFSMADNARSIPSIMDGLKPSQRKVLFGILNRSSKAEIKVMQLAGEIGHKTAYHHGEQSLVSTIISMAQDFLGSNNLNLLLPKGQFGTRLMGGKDHASARYIFTRMNELCQAVFPKDDMPLLEYKVDDGQSVEPEYYVGIIPMVLVNGCDGIGTGFSTSIPCFNPEEICNIIRNMLNGKSASNIDPWYRGFQGSITKKTASSYTTRGTVAEVNDNTLDIMELPIGQWTADYQDYLKNEINPTDKKGKKKSKASVWLKDFSEFSTERTVGFRLTLLDGVLDNWKKNPLKMAKTLKLERTLNTSNMHAHDKDGEIVKYTSVKKIFEAFYEERHALYVRRKDYLIKKFTREKAILDNKKRFLEELMNDTLDLFKKPKSYWEQKLEERKYGKFDLKSSVLDEKPDENGSYYYLTSMQVSSMSAEDIEKLE
jgi:DNA topoisomerase-2